MRIQALVVPVICNPLTSQPISHTKETYDHLVELELVDSANAEDCLEVDVYWNLVTGEVRRGNYGPMAIHMKIGWVLSGRTGGLATSVNLSACTTTHPVIYLWIEVNNNVSVISVAAKTRVTPIRIVSIPRLELLSALLLSRLVVSVEGALQSELQLDGTICYTDLKVTLYWIQGKNHEWKQFVGNRVASI